MSKSLAMKTVFPLAPGGWAITIEFNILEIAFVVAGDEEMKRGKDALRKFMAAETLNNIAITSQKRQEQESYCNVCLLGELSSWNHGKNWSSSLLANLQLQKIGKQATQDIQFARLFYLNSYLPWRYSCWREQWIS